MRENTSSTSSGRRKQHLQTSSVFLTRQDLIARWHCSSGFVRNLKGLDYFRFHGKGKALYKIEDVERFERENLQKCYFCELSDSQAA